MEREEEGAEHQGSLEIVSKHGERHFVRNTTNREFVIRGRALF